MSVPKASAPKAFVQRGAYPIKQGFDWLGVGQQRGYDLINSGLLKSFLLGRRRMCTHKALEECLDQLQQGKGSVTARKRATNDEGPNAFANEPPCSN